MTKDIIFVSSYFNNPHFIRYQSLCFKHSNNTYDFIVLNDAKPDTKCLLSNKLAYNEIEKECKKYGAIHIPIPQNIHDNVSKGGLTPDGLPTSHPTERHRSAINYFNINYHKLVIGDYKALVILDSDLFIKPNVNLLQVLGDYDIVGAKVSSARVKQDPNNPSQWWPPAYKHITSEITIRWPWCIFVMVNLEKHKNIINELDIGGFAGTDSGGMIHFFIDRHKLKLEGIPLDNPKGYEQLDIAIYKNREIFVHYRGGSNWDYQSKTYYFEKIYRLFEKYFPEFYKELEYINKDCKPHELMSRDKEYIFKDGLGKYTK